mmetsp:Transcript_112444/g.195294  ORF Transcript_112444/g.195294 Transcript_112444/m.195294 type:complete len:91 (+) Transcript_112444:185-457(+)
MQRDHHKKGCFGRDMTACLTEDRIQRFRIFHIHSTPRPPPETLPTWLSKQQKAIGLDWHGAGQDPRHHMPQDQPLQRDIPVSWRKRGGGA